MISVMSSSSMDWSEQAFHLLRLPSWGQCRRNKAGFRSEQAFHLLRLQVEVNVVETRPGWQAGHRRHLNKPHHTTFAPVLTDWLLTQVSHWQLWRQKCVLEMHFCASTMLLHIALQLTIMADHPKMHYCKHNADLKAPVASTLTVKHIQGTGDIFHQFFLHIYWKRAFGTHVFMDWVSFLSYKQHTD